MADFYPGIYYREPSRRLNAGPANSKGDGEMSRTLTTELRIKQTELLERTLLDAIDAEFTRTHEGFEGVVYDTNDIRIMPLGLHDEIMVSVDYDCDYFPMSGESTRGN